MKKRNSTIRKRGLALFLVLTMCFGMLQTTAFASEMGEEDYEQAGEPTISVISVERESSSESSSEPDTSASEASEPDTSASEASEPDTSASEASEADTDASDASEPETEEAGNDEDSWDLTKTERPEASEEVSFGTGTYEDKIQDPETDVTDRGWEEFYDEDTTGENNDVYNKDVYDVTFNIDEDTDDAVITIDLTKALELLGQYAESGKQELEDAKMAVERPVMGEMPEAPVAPEKPVAPEFEQVEPKEPGKPENLDNDLVNAYETYVSTTERDEEGEPSFDEDAVKAMLAESTGLSVDDAFVKQYADYMYDQAMVDWCVSSWDTWKAEGHPYASFGDMDTFLYYGCSITVKWPDGYNKGTPVLTVPEYVVDKTSQAYKDYEEQMDAYKAAYEEYLAENGPGTSVYEAYQEAMSEYEAAMDAYHAAVAEYEAAKAAIEAKYADDKAAYDAAIAALEAEYDRRINANNLQPGDVKKFLLSLTSDSKHTYQYIDGSFTLATPDMEAFYAQLGVNPDGSVVGFDGQLLGGRDVVAVDAAITYMSNPMMSLFEQAGISRFDVSEFQHSVDFKKILNGWYDFVTQEQLDKVHELLSIEKNPTNEELRDAVLQWVIDYYSTDSQTYKDLEDLVANNPLARTELSSNNFSDLIGGSDMSISLSGGYNYDNFYQALFSFAFGDNELGVVGLENEDGSPVTFEQFLNGMKFNEMTNRWEYGNCSWTDNGYQNALYYYMDHQEIWEQTDAYFHTLLEGGLNADEATWTSLMMALNIDGRLGGNNWQDTMWPWYSSIQLERMDIDFSLSKTDENGETITSSETEFQIYYIDNVVNDDGTVTSVNMYCTQTVDDEGNISYTFVTTPSTIWTDKGELNISYAMMKDIVYYLQEMTAPEGYERDSNVYIVMSEEDYNKLSDEEKAALEGTFDAFLDMTKSDDGLSVSTNFVNVKIVTTPEEPVPTPEDPETPPPGDDDDDDDRDTPSNPRTPEPTPEPTPEIPDELTPLANVPETVETPEDIEIPEENVPLAELTEEEEVEIPEENVPLAEVPQTGDISVMWYVMTILAACGLVSLMVLKTRKEEQND